MRLLLAGLSILFLACGACAVADAPQSAKPWTRWWWPASAVDRAEITRQLEILAAAGIGGVEITPIYGARGYEDRTIEFLSPRWIEMLDHTAREARRLDWKIMKEVDLVTLRYTKFDASDWAPAPTGLLGPVRLVPLDVVRLR